jgi:hypothetical protein
MVLSIGQSRLAETRGALNSSPRFNNLTLLAEIFR